MLQKVTIRNIYLIESVTLELSSGFSVISGETGTGKTVLLEALGLALGGRAEAKIIRKGSDQGMVSVTFELLPDHKAWDWLNQEGFFVSRDEPLTLRRVLSREGALSRAFVNEDSITVASLKRFSQLLIDVHEQFDRWLSPQTQMNLIDAHGGGYPIRQKVSDAWNKWQQAQKDLHIFQDNILKARTQRDFLLESLEELEALNPQAHEEDNLIQIRQNISEQAKRIEVLEKAQEALHHPTHGVLASLASCARWVTKASSVLEHDRMVQAIDRAFAELEDLGGELQQAIEAQNKVETLEALDDRLFHLRQVARKHQVSVNQLQDLLERLREQMGHLDMAQGRQDLLEDCVQKTRDEYLQYAALLREKRVQIGLILEKKINKQLPALKLDRCQFFIVCEELPPDQYGSTGIDRVEFRVIMNASGSPEPLMRVVSGGEFSRLILALKVVFAQGTGVVALIFDEIDSGTGGAIAQAIGSSLYSLSHHLQVIVITHSPQVTVYAQKHWKVRKDLCPDNGAIINVTLLDDKAHLEEVARMLAGSEITEEARSAAFQLKQLALSAEH